LEINLSPSAIFKAGALTIRPMLPGDADGLMALMNAESHGPLRSDLPHSIADHIRTIFLNRTKYDFRLVAVCAGEIIGQVCLRPSSQRTATLTINVREDYRRYGIATTLLEHMIIKARQASARDCIEVDVFHDNRAAIGLYEKLGFETKSARIGEDGCKILNMSKSMK
jgi:putative acetyltransferase